jgi:hypothetical protein
MTREKLLSAIRVGLKRGTPESIADAIEMALELEMAPAPEETAQPHGTAEDRPLAPPVNPEAMKEKAVSEEVPYDIRGRAPMVTLATEDDMKKAVEIPKGRTPIRIRSLLQGSTARKSGGLNIQQAISLLQSRCPEVLRIVADGRDQEYALERNVNFLPGIAAGRGKPIDMVKVSYKHPAVEDKMEVSRSMVVGDMTEDFDPGQILEEIAEEARHMYRPRPANIVPRQPPPPDLSYHIAQNGRVDPRDAGRGLDDGTPQDQDVIAHAAKSGPQAVAALSDQIRKSG